MDWWSAIQKKRAFLVLCKKLYTFSCFKRARPSIDSKATFMGSRMRDRCTCGYGGQVHLILYLNPQGLNKKRIQNWLQVHGHVILSVSCLNFSSCCRFCTYFPLLYTVMSILYKFSFLFYTKVKDQKITFNKNQELEVNNCPFSLMIN